MTTFMYPSARRDDTVVDDYHGCKVADPYRWLEDPYSDETVEFVHAQNKLTVPYLEGCECREKLNKRITELWNYPKYGCPQKHGDKWYYFYNSGLQNQSVMYVQSCLDGPSEVFLDPNLLSEEGTTSISTYAFSEDGKYLAYGLSEAGSDWVYIKIKSTESKEDFPEVLKHCKFTSLSWTHDNLGFFYNIYPTEDDGKSDGTEVTTNLNQQLCYHKIGTDQSVDVVCANWPDNPKWTTGATVSDCGGYVVCTIHEGCDPVNRLYICKLSDIDYKIEGCLPFVKIVDNFDAEYDYITNEGSLFTFKTNLNAPRYKVINIDINNYDQSNWRKLIDEQERDVLQWASCVAGNKLVLCYLIDVKSALYVHCLTTGEKLATFPLDIGDVQGFSGDKRYTEIFYKFVSFLTPGIIYYCNLKDGYDCKVFNEIKLESFDASQFETKQVFYSASDDANVKIPMFIVHRKNLALDGSNPVFLYGYGGFNISICPTFSVSRLVFISHLSGVLAVPNIRGGGEYGETWHKAGMLKNKQNVFNDFQMAATYLIDNKYCSADRITINGGSNGGLLVAACANQRPDLFGCAIAQVGVMDMLRFHKFTIGHAWTTDFGCSDNKEDFQTLIKYSPLHNIHHKPPHQYPATLLLTGDHDDRVVPLHSLKFIAQLQHVFRDIPSQMKPLFIKVDVNTGHGAGKPTLKTIEELTEIYCFIILNLNLKWVD
ncbi:hypothetical protein HELRODRAFT_187164 [Helobdella robusta]|uniref:Prolyl endopeptidase n=1 Tax=Helobdella robusta TaxID=6412 RepID=T1FP74_HELRO|nr:hypothetical protein HELRODRAFT_187164 [Helobdella robusta]ESO01437.1 hypothetical protein HELRODRAFT_187164 [Helobdella robusta]